MFYRDLEERKKRIREFIVSNPRATSKDIRDKLHTKIMKVYAGGMAEAFQDAGVSFPRTFKRMTVEEKKKILIDYVRENPTAGGHTIKKDTKINFQSVFKNTKELFDSAGLSYLRAGYIDLLKRGADYKRKLIIDLLKKDPLMSLGKIGRVTQTHPHSLFKNSREMHAAAGIPFFSRGEKRRFNKRNLIVRYIQANNFATQREINRACRTRVQEIFDEGIFEAYRFAGVIFPYERIRIHGAAIRNIKRDAIVFEENIASMLSGYGKVNRLVKTGRGVADIILERNNAKIAIELKNYKSHDISISEIKQVNKYLGDIGSNIGFLICLKKPRRDSFLMGGNRIFVLTESELHKIPEIVDLSFKG